MTITFYKVSSNGETRYYTIHDRQGHLFGHYTLTAIWGSALNAGKEKVHTFENSGEMERKVKEICRAKLRQGYRVLYSFSRRTGYREYFKRISARTG